MKNVPDASNSSPISTEKPKVTPNKMETAQDRLDSGNFSSSHKFKKCTPDKKSQLRFQGIFNSPLQTIQEKTKSEGLQWASTPTRRNVTGPSTTNPFEVEVESLSVSSFSPSVFTITGEKSQEGVSFRWSIEQMADLEPADIDETSQQVICVDSEKERKAQRAIDIFFSKNHIAPSPWTPTVKYMSFSPRATSDSNRPHVEVRKIKQVPNPLEDGVPCKEVSTQTMVTIPSNLDLERLLGRFCTYYEDAANSSSTESSHTDADMLSTSSLRRKLFITEDKLASPSLIKDQANNDLAKYMTPEPKTSPVYPTPSSDQFSSSPITPRNWSLSPNLMPFLSPNISPICVKSRKTLSPISRLMPQRDSEFDENIEGLQLCAPLEIETESLCNTSWDMSKPENIVQQENSDFPAFPNTYTDSSSNQRDTGYLTGSLNSMISQQISSYMQLRTTPVAELLEDFAITKLSQQCLQQQQDPKGNGLKGLGDDDCSMMSFCCDQSSSGNLMLKNMPWNPSGFSTPTKSS